jgi:hypothetical protein
LDVGSLTPGEYEVTVQFYVTKLLGWQEDLESNSQRFSVLK